MDKLIGVPKHLGRVDPTQDVTQSAMETETKGNFDSDPALKFFLSSTRELKNSKSADTGAVSNVCNPQRSVNVATVYLAKALGLDVGSLVDSYTYNWAASRSFPMNPTEGPSETFEPTGDEGQAYWTLLDQYTAETEPELRAGKGRNWCHHQGIGVHSHCLQVWTRNTSTAPHVSLARQEAGDPATTCLIADWDSLVSRRKLYCLLTAKEVYNQSF